jgi:hypothetical protein
MTSEKVCNGESVYQISDPPFPTSLKLSTHGTSDYISVMDLFYLDFTFLSTDPALYSQTYQVALGLSDDSHRVPDFLDTRFSDRWGNSRNRN